MTPALTPRQREVLACMLRGLSAPEAARELGMGVGTVKTHLAAMYRILHVNNRVQLVLVAQRDGLLTAEDIR
jgi:DNA-binding CsgD family transcriptional regulator